MKTVSMDSDRSTTRQKDDRQKAGREPSLTLGIAGFTYGDLQQPARLERLFEEFDRWLSKTHPDAHARFEAYRKNPESTDALFVSETLLAVAPHVGTFVAQLFGVAEAVASKSLEIRVDDPVFQFKREFAKKRVLSPKAGQAWAGAPESAKAVADAAWRATGTPQNDDEELYVAKATLWLHEIDDVARKAAKAGGAAWTTELRGRVALVRDGLVRDARAAQVLGEELSLSGNVPTEEEDARLVARVCDAIEAALAARRLDPADPARTWVSLHQPHKWNFESLVPLHRSRPELPEEFVGPLSHRREREEPFALTDRRGSMREVAAEIDYCLYCHDRDKDSCSKGLRDKTGAIKKNPLGVALEGCPLFEKISEMHILRRSGEVIGALATAIVDNPMLAGTGHRICNDCMKGCVYQTQEPVNIPQIETRILVDVLHLPWGFEIYSFLTRWNPLNVRRPYALPYNGKNVMVVGLGPAGYTLAHHLLNEGFGVIGVDGLKLEPLPSALVGSDTAPPQAIYDVGQLEHPLESRTLSGFGGVSEYGITVRWDKNFLTMIYLNLSRRRTFRAFGGVRFGGTLTLDDAWAMGIDHVAIAAGSGKPTLIPMKNGLLRGIRKASDFLMALQLTGAYKRDSLANLQVRLPAVVIGGGLTAIDTATELLAYYVVQAERTLLRYETLSAEEGEDALRKRFDAEELETIDEVVSHGRAIRAERERARRGNEPPRIQELLNRWGGVSLVYRRTVKDSPAYRLNHEEVAKSLEEGVRYVELMAPVEAHPDARGAVEAVSFERQKVVDGRLQGTGEVVTLKARTVCVAAGTSPNVTYEKEYPGTFALDGRGYFQNHRIAIDADGLKVVPTPDGSGFFTSYLKDGHTVSYYGDNHPKYAGSVVKAMASAKNGYAEVARLYESTIRGLDPATQDARDRAFQAFATKMEDELGAVVHTVHRLATSIVEVVVRAPLAAKKFKPGQFYRLQNFETSALRIENTPLLMEGLAMTGAWTDPEKGLLSLIVLEMGSSSRMVAMLKPGQRCVVMGPTGAPTEIAPAQTVLLAGGGLGNAVLFSIARAFKASGSKVLYFAGYRSGDSLFKMDEIEASTDQVIWATDSGPEIAPRRPQDRHFRGNIVQAMVHYAQGTLAPKSVELSEVNRIIAIGSDKMMEAVKDARHGVLQPYLDPKHAAIGSINSPMQCMMKEICAQCLQKHVDPVTGEETVVYSCFNQDQELDRVDFSHLASRLRQNSAQEKLTAAWFDRLGKRGNAGRI